MNQAKIIQKRKSLLGNKEIKGFLEGEYSCNEARALLKKNTRHYAKHQLSWFKRDKSIEWIEVGQKDTAEVVAEKIGTFLVEAVDGV
ncbi:MAG: hypothetical protein D4S01_04805 [Dehalococcoidia bacterium]|nr:MAG: hypothetical protein D4S01_04805 [Dehalococcoidia bacterium]